MSISLTHCLILFIHLTDFFIYFILCIIVIFLNSFLFYSKGVNISNSISCIFSSYVFTFSVFDFIVFVFKHLFFFIFISYYINIFFSLLSFSTQINYSIPFLEMLFWRNLESCASNVYRCSGTEGLNNVFSSSYIILCQKCFTFYRLEFHVVSLCLKVNSVCNMLSINIYQLYGTSN